MSLFRFSKLKWGQQGGGKLARSFVERTEWHENYPPIQGIVVVRGSCDLGGPLDSPTSEASLLSLSSLACARGELEVATLVTPPPFGTCKPYFLKGLLVVI